MAKRRGRRSTETRIEGFAEDLGRLLGTARAKADNWLGQRQQIAKQLTEIRDTAAKLLADLGRQTRTIIRGAKKELPRKRTLSAAARKAISRAQKARWAGLKAGKKKTAR